MAPFLSENSGIH